jgi:hypothetical protein
VQVPWTSQCMTSPSQTSTSGMLPPCGCYNFFWFGSSDFLSLDSLGFRFSSLFSPFGSSLVLFFRFSSPALFSGSLLSVLFSQCSSLCAALSCLWALTGFTALHSLLLAHVAATCACDQVVATARKLSLPIQLQAQYKLERSNHLLSVKHPRVNRSSSFVFELWEKWPV